MGKAPLATAEDAALVKDFVLLQILLEALDRDIALLGKGKGRLKLAVVYIATLLQVQQLAAADLALIRGKLGRSGIRIYEEQRTLVGVAVRYLCRGYHHTFRMLWSLAKPELYQRLAGYIRCLAAEAGSAP